MTCLLGLLGLLLPAAPVRSDEKIPADRIAPAKSVLYATFPSVPELQERFEQSVWIKMWNDPGMRGLRTSLEGDWKEAAEELKREVGLNPDQLWGLLKGEVSIIASRVSRGRIGAAAIVEVGEESPDLDRLIDVAEDHFEREEFLRETKEVDGTQIITHSLKETKFSWFRKDGYLVAGNDLALLEAILLRWDGQHADVLAEREDYRYIMNRCWKDEGEPALRWFIDPIAFVRTTIESHESTFQQATYTAMLPQLGVDRIKGLGGTLDIATEKYEIVNQVLFCVDPPISGVMRAVRGDAIVQPIPNWVRSDALYFWSINWDIAGAWNTARELTDQFQGDGAFDRIIAELADAEDGPKIHPKRDVVDNLSGQFVLESSRMNSSDDVELETSQVLGGIGVKDPRKMQEILSKVSALEGSPLKSREFLGQTLFEVEGLTPEPIGMTVQQGMLFVTNNSARLEEIVRGSEGQTRMADLSVFKQLQSDSPEKVSVWGIDRIGQQLVTILEQTRLLQGLADGDSEEEDLELPDPATLKKYPLDRWFYIIPDERGAYWRDYILRQ